MIRSKAILLLMIVMPVLIIGVLSGAMKDLLNNDDIVDEFKAGYMIIGDMDEDMLIMLEEICSQYGIQMERFEEYNELYEKHEDVEYLLKNNKVKVFIDISNNEYSIYQSDEGSTYAGIMENILYFFFYTMQEQMVDDTAMNTNVMINTEMLPVDKMPDSYDYYGIIEIVFFISFGMISLSAVILSEKKNLIISRMQVAPVSRIKMYLGKLLPCITAICLETGIAAGISILLFDIHWGDPMGSILILLLLSFTASAWGIFMFYLFNNVAVSIVIAWIIIFISGFLGGSFQTYMLSDIPDNLAKLSPHYYINRTLVEFSTMGSSEYTGKCFIILLSVFVASVFFGWLLMNKRLEE